jgi:hypothetical protein
MEDMELRIVSMIFFPSPMDAHGVEKIEPTDLLEC